MLPRLFWSSVILLSPESWDYVYVISWDINRKCIELRFFKNMMYFQQFE